MTLGIKGLFVTALNIKTLSHYAKCHILFIVMMNYAECNYGECHSAECCYVECRYA